MGRLHAWLARWRRRRVYFNPTDICRVEQTGELVVPDGHGGFRRTTPEERGEFTGQKAA